MSALYQIKCPDKKCPAHNDIHEQVCSTCGTAAEGTLNTRRASLTYEITALEKRYTDAAARLAAQGLLDEATLLEQFVTQDGKAVINVSLNFLWLWVVQDSADYVSYRRQIIDDLRKKAGFANDVKRCVHDSLLFGSEADMIYAALSVDGSGLTSYGPITVVLNIAAVEKRTSALEYNSYHFVEWAITQGWNVNQELPAGYMSTWYTKNKLALAKLEKGIKKGLKPAEIGKMVLNSGTGRADDNFIELHVFGKISSTAIERVIIPGDLKKSADRKTMLRLQELESKITAAYHP